MSLDWYNEYTKPRYFKIITPSNLFEYIKFCPHQLSVPKGYILFQQYEGYKGAYCDDLHELYSRLDIVQELTEDEFNSAIVLYELVN